MWRSSLRSLAVFKQFDRAKKAAKPAARDIRSFAALCARALTSLKTRIKNWLNRQVTQASEEGFAHADSGSRLRSWMPVFVF